MVYSLASSLPYTPTHFTDSPKEVIKTKKIKENKDKGLKVAITFTVFTQDAEYIEWYSGEYLNEVARYLGYNIIKMTVGKHIVAERPHFHICVILVCDTGKKYKCLNEKINRMWKDTNFCFMSQTQSDKEYYIAETDSKISFIYEGEQKKFKNKVKLYDESALGYPFKEYKEFKEIMVDLQYGFTESELEEMRKIAHLQWLNWIRGENKKEAEEQIKKQENIKLYDYLKHELQDIEGDFRYLVKETISLLLKYKKLHTTTTSFRVMCLKDQAISYLYLTNRITEDEIIEYINV